MRLRPRTQSVPTDLRQRLQPYNLHCDDYNLFLEILISPHSNMVGVFFCPKMYLSGDLRWDLDRVEKHLSRLVELKLVYNDAPLGILMIAPTLGMSPIEEFRNPKSVDMAVRILHCLPPSTIYRPLITHLDTLKKPLLKPILRKLSELSVRREADS